MQVVVEAVRGKSFRGDIAFDNVVFTDGICIPTPGRSKKQLKFKLILRDAVRENKKDLNITEEREIPLSLSLLSLCLVRTYMPYRGPFVSPALTSI